MRRFPGIPPNYEELIFGEWLQVQASPKKKHAEALRKLEALLVKGILIVSSYSLK
jgi:hypothetical protein